MPSDPMSLAPNAPSSDPRDAAERRATAAVESAVSGRRLLTHPFYRRWEAGQLGEGELGDYAAQYRAFEAALPAVLASVARRLRDEGDVASATTVERNLADELGRPRPHLELFDAFARAVGADPATPPGPAATALVATYSALVDEGPAAALAGLAAYETQAAAVASTKAAGLRRWYGTPPTGTAFWDVHARMDDDHAEWATAALDSMGADPDDVYASARRGAEAWWAFLDEREARSGRSADLGAHH
jgi:pyrroloquinoline-quinone synthase